MEEKRWAVFTGYGDEYKRDFGDGNKIVLEKGIARPISKEVAAILKDAKDVVIIKGFSDDFIHFTKRLIREKYRDLVKRHGVERAAKLWEEQNVRIGQGGNKKA